MHRKNYEAMAKVILNTLNEVERSNTGTPQVDTLATVAVRMAAVFAADNPAFQHNRFMDACGFPQPQEAA